MMRTSSQAYCTAADVEPDRDELTALRRRIHQHPELSHKEVETARLVAEKLRSWGYDVTEGVGGTGVVGRLKVGSGTTPFVHTSRYDFNDENLTVGAAYWTRLVERYLVR